MSRIGMVTISDGCTPMNNTRSREGGKRQRTEGILALSLADLTCISPRPSSHGLCGGIRERVTHVWVVYPPSPTLEKMVNAKFYNPVMSMRLSILPHIIPEQDCVLLLELIAGKGLRYLCETGDGEDDAFGNERDAAA
ncbi:hypothetical protein F5146DRAFT_1002140 [Armillaria mellea]|nr:hypothetical protein F5146DRAFT_1002140 [Armillaria mellea]